MSHAVENMFSVAETPWHGLGRVLEAAPTIPDAIRLAGLDWRVRCVPVECEGKQYPELGKIVMRESDNTALGCVGPNWTPLQNADAFQWFEPFLADSRVALETAGSLHSGRVVWVMAKLAGDETIRKGDDVRPYLLLSNSHDGSASVRVGFSPIRVVCWNTLSASHRNANSKLLRIKHTPGMHYTLSTVRDTIDTVVAEFRATAEQYRALAYRKINREDLRRYVQQVVVFDPSNITRQEVSKVDECEAFAINGRGNIGYSLWDAYNGVTEYLAWVAGRTQDTRLNSLWYGKGKECNDAAFALALQLAA